MINVNRVDLKSEHDVKIDFDTLECTEEELTDKEKEDDLWRQISTLANKSKSTALGRSTNTRMAPRDRANLVVFSSNPDKDRDFVKGKRTTHRMEDSKKTPSSSSSSNSSKENSQLPLFKETKREKPKVPLFMETSDEPIKMKKQTIELFKKDEEEEEEDGGADEMEDDIVLVKKPKATKPEEEFTFSLQTSDSRMDF